MTHNSTDEHYAECKEPTTKEYMWYVSTTQASSGRKQIMGCLGWGWGADCNGIWGVTEVFLVFIRVAATMCQNALQ